MTQDCNVVDCRFCEGQKCDLGFLNHKRCNIWLYYHDPGYATELTLSEQLFCREMLGKLDFSEKGVVCGQN